MYKSLICGVVWICASAAGAADKLAFAPTPAWVKPVAIPADTAKPDEAAIRVLLLDEQYDLEPGKPTRYSESLFRIQTPQGLAAGGATFAWNPETQTPVVHKLLIRRGDQVIDVLKSGQTFTVVRRESNLENAVIDGVLTATIQPEGLQVGDTIDFALSITESDPAIGDHLEQAAAAWNGIGIAHAHLAARWPSAVAMRLRAAGGATLPKPVKQRGFETIELTQDDVRPIQPPKGAPLRYQQGRLIEASDFASWGEMAAVFAPLFAKAAVLPASGPLADEVARIRSASADPKTRAQAALTLVQDRVRYVALFLNDGGLVPADAATTWARRFGDCKAKTVMLIGILHALGIAAEPVLVSSVFGDGMDQRLPMVRLFNHVLVRATIAGRSYWLDGTRTGDTRIDDIATPDFRWGLPLTAGTKALVAMIPAPFASPQTEVAIRIDARGGITLPAPVHVERIVRGDDAVVANMQIANLPAATRDTALRSFWKQRYDFIDATGFANAFDSATRTLTMTVDGTTKMDWNDGFYEADHVWVGWKADFARDPGPDRDAPYAVAYPTRTHVTETILLPPAAGTFTVNAAETDVDQSVAGIRYARHSVVKDGVFTVTQDDASLASEFPASEAPAAEAALRALAKKTVYLKQPANYRRTKAELDAALSQTPTTADGFVYRGNDLLNVGRNDEAIADFDRALALDPKNVVALADRGFARMNKDNIPGARADAAAARAIDPRNAVMLRLEGVIAGTSGDLSGAARAFTASLAAEPNNAYALAGRAKAEFGLGDNETALRDAGAALKADPNAVDLYLLRLNAFNRMGDMAGVLREADAAIAAAPTSTFVYVAAAKAYMRYGRKTDAMRLIDRALAIRPDAYIYLNRYDIRDKADRAGRLADIDAALKADPRLVQATVAKARMQGETGDWKPAIATLDAAVTGATPDTRLGLLLQRGIAYAHAGDTAHADADFAAARALATTPVLLNNLCWSKATDGVALATALDECDAAVAGLPEAGFLDSRGLVLLRLGRLDDSIATYGRALAMRATLAGSLFGRAVAEARKGDKAASDRDLAAALKADPDIRTEFAGYGVTL